MYKCTELSILSFFYAVLCRLLTLADPAQLDVAWTVVHRDLQLAFSHTEIMELIARKMGAYW